MLKKLSSSLWKIPALIMFAVAVSVISIDIYAPALPQMADWFNCSQEALQFSMSAGILASSLITPFVGPLSDALGRRNIFVYSQGIYVLGAFLAIFSPTIEAFILCRLIQGFGGATAMVLGFAIITDVYKGAKIATYFAYITTTITSSLVLAPLLGGFLTSQFNWQACFVFLTCITGLSMMTLLFLLPETLQQKSPVSLKGAVSTYKSILMNRQFMGLALIPSLMIGGIVTFVSCSSFYFIEVLGISPKSFGIYQALIMVCNTLFSYLAGRSINVLGLPRTIRAGVGILTFGSLSFVLTSLIEPDQAALISAAMAIYGSGIGLVFGAITAQSMNLYPKASGAAAAALNLVRGLTITLCVSIGSIVYNGKIVEVALFLGILTIFSVSLYWYTSQKSSKVTVGQSS